MKKLMAVFMALMLLCGCASPAPVENTGAKSPAQTPAESAKVEEAPSAEVEIPEGYREADFGEYSLLICDDSFADCAPGETVAAENDQFIGDENRVIGELLSVEAVSDKENPFAPYDEKYAAAVNSTEMEFNGFAAKKYHTQSQADPSLSVLTNKIYYCIEIDGDVLTFAYYPVMGLGGLHAENMENVLSTIRAK